METDSAGLPIQTVLEIVQYLGVFVSAAASVLPDRRLLRAIVVLTALAATVGAHFAQRELHRREVAYVQAATVQLLRSTNDCQTLDEVLTGLNYVPLTLATEAIGQAENLGVVRHEVRQLRTNQGAFHAVRFYCPRG